MVMAKADYEEYRIKRVEENRRRMEQLNLHMLSDSLKKTVKSSNRPSRPVKARLSHNHLPPTPLRRSSRVAEKPPPNYKEYAIDLLASGRRVYKRRDLLNRVYASDHDRIRAIERAEDLEAGLGSEFPAFVKPMLQSHVTGGFWLGLPLQFCKAHLPNHDEMVVLVDEDNHKWDTKYLTRKGGLSGGWRGFSIDHDLVDGDALVFQLIKPTTFKVYIIRAKSPEEREEINVETHEAPDVSHAEECGRNKRKGKARKKGC